jgi:hypothetical protein
MMHHLNMIKDASTKHQSEREVASGILKSGMLTDFQRTAIDGVIKSAMPARMDKGATEIHKVKGGATKKDIGVLKWAGAPGMH